MQFVQLVISGVAQGCIYGLIALGFVLIYKATETVSFAQGELMMLGAFCGLALLFGVLLGPAAAALAFAMLVAIFSVHFDKGLFLANNGYEFGLALFAASVSLLISGAGRLSVDAALAARTATR